MTAAPPDIVLALTPDTVLAGVADLNGLHDVDWKRLRHANYDAEHLPDVIEALAADKADWDTRLDALLGGDVLHQGGCFPATAPVLEFLIRITASGTLPAGRRYKVCEWLVFATYQRASVFLSAPGLSRSPEVPVYVQEVYDTIGAHLPLLLARWSNEPPAVRYVLATLAGLFPEPGRSVTDEVVAMAGEYAGTQSGTYLDLAAALLRDDEIGAMRISRDIYGWNAEIPLDWLEASGVPAAVRAGRILADGIVFGTTTR